tara:strand:- start:227 stop:616 length:390 start_codon:yes stop_codon:yes gene_type:complete
MKRGYINLTDIKNAPELSDEIKPPSNAKKYMHNQSVPKQDPTKLTMMKLWDSFAQMRRYPNYFERWIMDEADLMEAELIRLGIDEGYNEDDLKQEYSGNILEATDADIITPIEETKKDVKSATQLQLFL